MSKFVTVLASTNKIIMGKPLVNAKSITEAIISSQHVNVDVCLFPAFALCGAQCGNFTNNHSFLNEFTAAVDMIKAVVSHGETAVVLGSYRPNECYIFTKDNVKIVNKEETFVTFYHANSAYTVYCGTIDDLLTSLSCNNVCETLLIPAFVPTYAGAQKKIDSILSTASEMLSNTVIVANGSVGDTSFPLINKPFCASFFSGISKQYKEGFFEIVSLTAKIDADYEKPAPKIIKLCNDISQKPMDMTIPREPYLQINDEKRSEFLDELFDLSANSLAIRMNNTGIKNLVIGVSGGLDSTLALLCCAKAVDILKLPRNVITAITMQGFGTSNKTYENAKLLMEKLKCEIKEIPIVKSVLGHFEDIGHDKNVHDVTYENSQARERTQILFDIANSLNALVVGTGDLSELSLGFCTFGGDHLASYNVNSCINKTTIRYLTRRLAQTQFADCGDLLIDIVKTPVSPELLPTSQNGTIVQKTEQILGEYELHDFFLYCYLKYNFSPNELLSKAEQTFSGIYDKNYIKITLQTFLKRFIQSQFKRSCAVDSSVITEINLSTNNFFIPSDMNSNVLTDALD